MKTKALSTILTYVNFLLVQGLASESLSENPATNFNGRILHGKPAAVSDFPFLVKLDIARSTGAGAIITEHWILTAGHCVYGHICSAVIEIFPAVWQPGESVKPEQCYPHPQYSKNTLAYDIGLIKVQENLLQDGRAKAVSLPAPGTIYPSGTQVVIAGWGQTESTNDPGVLLWGDFRVETWDYCSKLHMEKYCEMEPNPNCVPVNIPRRILCTHGQGSPPGSTCFGDSGGPAVINGVIAGVVSFGISKGDTCGLGEPTMHTSVVDYLPWIYSHTAPGMDTSGIQVRPED